MPADPARVESVFNSARALSTAARGSHLDAACAGDAELRARVERLLAADAELEAAPGTATFAPEPGTAAYSTEGSPADPGAAHDPGPHLGAGAVLAGKYKLIEEIGAGGMGAVWTAQQTEPVRRRVAVKVIRAGMDSRQVLVRFEAERQALALMDHPNIARVLDAGTTADRRPFFAMELVKGVPITRYCDEHRLTPRERLELFVPVCQAIQHAHQKGIIHRDIKPGNVLVARYDDLPVPKVIDFGVAKAVGEPLTDGTLATGFGAVVGTPEYMSPEQASFNNLDVDTRSDVYALGVLLYELLAGSPPFSRKELETVGLLEILRVIREQEPPHPSTKLSTAEALPALSANRSTEPAKLTRLLRGDLDWIVMKALEKDRGRRYETPSALARDVERHLRDEAVEARGPSKWYRLRKFVRRNRGPVLATALVLAALGVGAVGWASSYDMTRQANTLSSAEAAQKLEAAEYLHFLEDGLLGGPDRQNPNRTVRASVDRAAESLDSAPHLDPCIEARLREVLGGAYLAMRVADRAEDQLTRAVQLFDAHYGTEPWTERDLGAKLKLAGLYTLLERHTRAGELREEILTHYRRKLEVSESNTHNCVCSMISLGECYADQARFTEGEALLAEALTMSRGPRGGRVLGRDAVLKWALQHHARCLIARKGYAAAEDELLEALTLAPRTEPERTSLDSLLGEALLGEGKYAEAEPRLLAGYKAARQRTGHWWPRDEARLTRAEDRLVELYTAWGKPDQAAQWRAERARRPLPAPPPDEPKH
jgi:serine/threonine protein kinase/tetratricopeptide (TPR) repeat protein